MNRNDNSQRRRSNPKRREVNQDDNSKNEFSIDFQDGEISQLDHASHFQKLHINKGKQSIQFSNIYFASIPFRQYITLDCDMMPFSYCCNQPVMVVLDKFGLGKIKCQNHPSLCKNQGIVAQSFHINLSDPQKQYEQPMEQINPTLMSQKYSKEISRRVVNGSYKVFNIQQKIKLRNKEIKKYIDDDIYEGNQFQQFANPSQNNSISSIHLKSHQNTLLDIQNISSTNNKPPKQRRDYYQNFLEKIDIPSLNVDNLVKEQELDEEDLYVQKSYTKIRSQNKGFNKNNQSGNTSSSITHTDESFIPSNLKKRLLTPERIKRKEIINGLPQSKLSEFKDIQPLKDIQNTKEYKTLQKIRQRISSVTGHSPQRRQFVDNQSISQLDGYTYNVMYDQKPINNVSQLKTQVSGSIILPNKRNLNTDINYLHSQPRSDSNYKLISQPALQSEMTAYTNQNVDINSLKNTQPKQENMNSMLADPSSNNASYIRQNDLQNPSDLRHHIKYSFTPLMYNDYRLVKNKNSPKSSLNPQQKPSLSPTSARTGNDHNKLHIFKSVLRKQLKPYRDMVQQLGAAPKVQINLIGNYRNSLSMQKSIIPTLI